MLRTCEGSYRGGVVLLKEQPGNLTEGPVLVTFLSSPELSTENARQTRKVREAVREVQSLFKHIPNSRVLSDELIAERRAEARNE